MVNPGAFPGSCKTFLLSQKEYYAKAVNDGFAAEAISLIQRRYFNRYPVEIPHDQEPSAEHLASVDDDAAIQEPEEPNPDVMSVEEYASALARLEERQKLVYFRKAQIKCWFTYQYMKDLDLDPTQTGSSNPYRALMFKLTGKKMNAPRKRSAANTYRKTLEQDVIEEKVRKLIQKAQETPLREGEKRESLIALRDRVAQEMFKSLSEDEQQCWEVVAKEEHQEAMKEWKKELERKPGTDPKSRQIAIQGLVKFLGPILNEICEVTGWKASFIVGGPEPAQGGLLNVVSIHSGTTSGDVKMNFGRAKRERFRKVVIPMYGGFLQKCYTPEECRARALQPEEGFLPLAQLDLENENTATDSISCGSPAAAAILVPVGSEDCDPGLPNTNSTVPSMATEQLPTTAAATGATSTKVEPTAEISITTNVVSLDKDDSMMERADAATFEEGNENEEVGEGINPFPFDIPMESPLPSPFPSPPLEDASPLDPVCDNDDPTPQVEPQSAADGDSMEVAVEDTAAALTQTGCSRRSQRVLAVKTAVRQKEREGNAGRKGVGKGDKGSRAVKENETAAGGPTPACPEVGVVDHKQKGGRRGEKRALTELNTQALDPRNDSANVNNNADSGSTSPPPAKRARKSVPKSSSSSARNFKVPEDAPQWFKKIFEWFSCQDLGEGWKTLMGKWGEFEKRSGYAGSLRLESKNRPEIIKDWIQRAQSTTWHPKIPNPASFGLEFMKWWEGIQPEWHMLESRKLLRISGGDFEELNRPGVNGLLSVIAALLFWGREVHNGAGGRDWLEAMVDVDYVLSQLLATPK